MEIPSDARKIRAYAIISKGDNICEEENCYFVPSQSSNGKYKVCEGDKWTCTCPDYEKRQANCKHIYAVRFWLSLREKLKQGTFKSDMGIKINLCVYCKSKNIVKDGSRITRGVKKQKYLCRNCGKRFIYDLVKRTKANAKIITLVLDLWFKGVSIRKIKDHIIQFYNLEIGKSTIQRWISRFIKELNKKTEGIVPRFPETIHMDEQMIKTNGRYMYCWNAIDKDTRFLLASNVSRGRKSKDANKVMMKLRNSKINANKIVTDKLMSYRPAIKKVLGNDVIHVANPSIRNIHSSNNIIERYHNTFRERDKIIRGFKSKETAQTLIDGYRLYYNFIRIHQGLGMTPSQKAGFTQLEGNRWIELFGTLHNHS